MRSVGAPSARQFGAAVHFEENRGQTHPTVRYLARVAGGLAFFRDREVVYAIPEPGSTGGRPTRSVFRVSLAGSRAVRPTAHGDVAGSVRYPSAHPSRSVDSVPLRHRLRYASVYPGVDLEYYGNGRKLEHDFVIAPGGSVARIRMRFEGPRKIELNRRGELVLSAGPSRLVQGRPIAYQVIAGRRRTVSARYRLLPYRQVGFDVGRHDRRARLVIDPITYLGGGAGDVGLGVDGVQTHFRIGNLVCAVDHVYVTGRTASVDFPHSSGALQPGGQAAFVSYLTWTTTNTGAAPGSPWSVYLGGPGLTEGRSLVRDPNGGVWVGGRTTEPTFPTTPNALRRTLAGSQDGFVVRLDADGALTYGTLLGGGDVDAVNGIDLDLGEKPVVAGSTSSSDFPTRNAFRSTAGGQGDAFVARIDPTAIGADQLAYGTYLPGAGADVGAAIAVDQTGRAWVAGWTASGNFPQRGGLFAFNRGMDATAEDAFLARVDPALTGDASLIYSGFIGGEANDRANGVGVDAAGRVILAGGTASREFPVSPGAVQPTFGGGGLDGFVVMLVSDGSAVVRSSFLGGRGADEVMGVGADAGQFGARLAGFTYSPDFPADDDEGRSNGVAADAFHGSVNATGDPGGMVQIGGPNNDLAAAITSRGYVVGSTGGGLTTHSPHQSAYGGGTSDALVAAPVYVPWLDPGQITFLAPPRNVQATMLSTTGVRLTWEDDNQGQSEEDFFLVQIKEEGDSKFVDLVEVAGNFGTGPIELLHTEEFFPGNAPEPDRTYKYRVMAVRLPDGITTWSKAVVITTLVEPTALVARSGPARVDVEWLNSSNREQGFLVERKQPGTEFALVETVYTTDPVGSPVTFRDVTVSPGVLYSYRVRAFSPSSLSAFSNEDSATPDPSYSVGGRVTVGGVALAGVQVSTVGADTLTAADGTYSLAGLGAGDHTIHAQKAGYTLSSDQVVSVPPDRSAVDFTATPIISDFKISGVITQDGVPLPGVQVKVPGATATTNGVGAFELVLPEGTYRLTPALAGFAFTPASRDVSIGPDASGQNFSATAIQLIAVGVAPKAVKGGARASGVVTFNLPVDAPRVVGLTSSSRDAVVPASVVVAAGNTSVGFSVKTRRVKKTAQVRITASSGGVSLDAKLKVKK